MMRVVIKPRVQKDKWSLYWKTSMMTRTEMLDEFSLEVAPATTARELKVRVAEHLGWQPVDSLLRLEGFVEPWELCGHRGVELPDASSLQAAGIKDGAEIVTVRKVLVAEGAHERRFVSGGQLCCTKLNSLAHARTHGPLHTVICCPVI